MSASAQSLSLSESASSSSSSSSSSRTIGWGRYALVGLGTMLAAVLANTVFYFIGSVLVTYDPDFIVLADVGGTIIFTLTPAVLAVLLYAALLRFTRRPARVFTIISAIVFVVTLIPDFTYIPTVPGSSNPQTGVLVLMHVIAATVIVSLLTRSTRSRHSVAR